MTSRKRLFRIKESVGDTLKEPERDSPPGIVFARGRDWVALEAFRSMGAEISLLPWRYARSYCDRAPAR